MINSFKNCPRQFYNSYVRRLAPKGINIDLLAGAAFARGLEVARRAFHIQHLPLDVATAHGLAALWKEYGDPPVHEDEVKTWDRVSAAYESYLAKYPLDADPIQVATIGGKPAIEFTFCLPVEQALHPETGLPLLVSGRCDWIGVLQGLFMNVDEKTTKAFNKNWAGSWDLRAQFMMYTWAAQQYGIKTEGTIVRGTAIQKTQIQHLETIIYQKPWKLDRWYEQLIRDLRRMVVCWIEDYWDFNLGEACNHYSGCPFREICKLKDERPWLPVYYQENTWNPLERHSDFVPIGPQNEPSRLPSTVTAPPEPAEARRDNATI